MKKKYIVILIIAVLILLGFVPAWLEPTKNGHIRINTWLKASVILGLVKMD